MKRDHYHLFDAVEVFRIVKAHIAKGMGRAIHPGTSACTYFVPSTGNKCFGGLFIPKSHPAQNYTGGWRSLCHAYGLDHVADVNLIVELQEIHDVGHNWDGVKLSEFGLERIRWLAKRNDVDYDSL